MHVHFPKYFLRNWIGNSFDQIRHNLMCAVKQGLGSDQGQFWIYIKWYTLYDIENMITYWVIFGPVIKNACAKAN